MPFSNQPPKALSPVSAMNRSTPPSFAYAATPRGLFRAPDTSTEAELFVGDQTTMELPPELAMKTRPLVSTAMPPGLFNPEETMLTACPAAT